MIEKTCGNCKHTDNDLGLVALHCDLLHICSHEDYPGGDKVRSWEKCCFEPSRWEERDDRHK